MNLYHNYLKDLCLRPWPTSLQDPHGAKLFLFSFPKSFCTLIYSSLVNPVVLRGGHSSEEKNMAFYKVPFTKIAATGAQYIKGDIFII